MELALLVWGISMLGPISLFLRIFALAAFIFAFVAYHNKWGIVGVTLGTLMIVVNIAIPNEKTAYTMTAAYAAQKVAQDPKVEQLSGKVLQIIENKLDSYLAKPADTATK